MPSVVTMLMSMLTITFTVEVMLYWTVCLYCHDILSFEQSQYYLIHSSLTSLPALTSGSSECLDVCRICGVICTYKIECERLQSCQSLTCFADDV